ncbi:uncharacterized protein LOC117188378 [Drosophila miranda]|nr:uncharacterized protein LOC117188378 [Drosophila miranda]
MCLSVDVGGQSKCYAIAICAFFYGLLDISVKSYCLVNAESEPFIIIGLSAWLPILLAASILLLGACQESRMLVQMSIVVAVCGGCLWIISSIGMLINTLAQKDILIETVMQTISLLLFIGLIGFLVYFPYRYLKELER